MKNFIDYSRFFLIVTIVALTFTHSVCHGQAISLNSETIKDYSIVVYNEQSVIQKKAANELQHYLKLIFGVKLKITNKKRINKDSQFFLLGEGFLTDSLNRTDTLPKDAFIKGIDHGNFYFGGKDDIDAHSVKENFFKKKEKANFGTLYATYDFLENDLGVHWFFPTYLGEHITSDTVFNFEEQILISKPAFVERVFKWTHLYYDQDTIMKWFLRNKLNVARSTSFHSWSKVLSREKYFSECASCFAKVNGLRRNINKMNKPAQLCTTNNDLIQLFIRESVQYLKDNPNKTYFSLSPNDNRFFCECDQCTASDTCFPVVKNYSELSCRIFNFYKVISDSLFAFNPNLEIGGYAYKHFCYPPEQIELSDNFHVRIAVNNYGFGNSKCSTMDTLKSIISSWTGKHKNLGFYSHPYGGFWVYPFLRTKTHQELIQFLANENIDKINLSFYTEWYSQGLDVWLISKMLWEPNINIDSLKGIYYEEVYPKSGSTIKYFHENLETNIERMDFCVPRYRSWEKLIPRIFMEVFNDSLLIRTNELLVNTLNTEIVSSKEQNNIENFLSIIDFLQMEHTAYLNYLTLRQYPELEEKYIFSEKIQKMQPSLCISPKSFYFRPDKSSSLYLKGM